MNSGNVTNVPEEFIAVDKIMKENLKTVGG